MLVFPAKHRGDRMNELCSARLLQPFMRFVLAHEGLRELVPEALWSLDPNSRLPVRLAHSVLARVVDHLRDDQLGLRHGRSMRFGEGGPFDYVLRSAPTVRHAIDAACRYSRLQSDSFRIWFEPWRSYGLIRMHDEACSSKPVAEFGMSALYQVHLSDGMPPGLKLECWFPYAAPSDPTEYTRSFRGARLKFNAPFLGFAFDLAYESAPMPGADRELHAVHCLRVDKLLADISGPPSARVDLRRVLKQTLRSNITPIAVDVARAMRMTPRTLSRKLRREGSSFSDELDAVRCELALRYLIESEISLAEVAFSLGFAHVESFYRAFRRWTGKTPLEYRSEALRQSVPAAAPFASAAEEIHQPGHGRSRKAVSD
jgi:AraC-like DNA-binding protein